VNLIELVVPRPQRARFADPLVNPTIVLITAIIGGGNAGPARRGTPGASGPSWTPDRPLRGTAGDTHPVLALTPETAAPGNSRCILASPSRPSWGPGPSHR
jgi:hypothetical protein